jgi:carboxymethylenebutenolidase
MADLTLTAADGTTFSAYRADPTGTPRGGVVVIQEIFGVNAHMRDVTDRYAEAGFVAVAPALFDRVESGVELAYDQEGMVRGQGIAWGTLTIEEALADVTATAAALAGELGGPGHVGVVGYCYGGMLAAASAARIPDQVAAAVAYYPSRSAQLLVDDRPQAPLLVHLGDEDQGITPEDGRTLATRWPTATFHHYAGAGHGFNCDQRAGFHAEAAALAFDRSAAFLADHLAGA